MNAIIEAEIEALVAAEEAGLPESTVPASGYIEREEMLPSFADAPSPNSYGAQRATAGEKNILTLSPLGKRIKNIESGTKRKEKSEIEHPKSEIKYPVPHHPTQGLLLACGG
ncbi:hypothetical protein KXQ82_15390 [Mucilaginibacter sp. HMF5004]|uniref:hypothetical protein n=1 Tax=Mucilaginibacter rivuli TaxID=2857527 RepID=UPI001C5F30D2|nr:hypothetical protein [Mucilaginibacter rivuli]MBW4891108.1 hypothetical protein [Mucilaginibacter rivuli]